MVLAFQKLRAWRVQWAGPILHLSLKADDPVWGKQYKVKEQLSAFYMIVHEMQSAMPTPYGQFLPDSLWELAL